MEKYILALRAGVEGGVENKWNGKKEDIVDLSAIGVACWPRCSLEVYSSIWKAFMNGYLRGLILCISKIQQNRGKKVPVFSSGLQWFGILRR
mmetsp:Transcript_42361/g.72347  ORF Transcript_42361/g.72347 Transcript_42361/m.72347 type:complete len:92 (+) Transcript_42361:334-609(+)